MNIARRTASTLGSRRERLGGQNARGLAVLAQLARPGRLLRPEILDEAQEVLGEWGRVSGQPCNHPCSRPEEGTVGPVTSRTCEHLPALVTAFEDASRRALFDSHP